MLPENQMKHTYYNCMGCKNETRLKVLMNLFPRKNLGCIKQKKEVETATKANGGQIELLLLTPQQKKELNKRSADSS